MSAGLDRRTPRLRVRPRTGWLNDPNGPVRWGDRYHLFFQHNPAGTGHDRIHWGHVSSGDLLLWEPEPLALIPSAAGADSYGCWSGCVIADGGVPTAVYTGVRPERPELGSICLARGDARLRTWVAEPEPVVPGPPPNLHATSFRDPFVFSFAGQRWAAVGAGLPDGPAVLVYRCRDLHRWTYAGLLIHPRDAAALAPADVWECPQIFARDGRWVLVVSLLTASRPGPVVYLTGNLLRAHGPDGGPAPRFVPRVTGRVDWGNDFYAPAVLTEPRRTLLWGWSPESCPVEQIAAAGWAGALTLPREIGVRADGRLIASPAPELAALRRQPPLVDRRVSLGAGARLRLGALPPSADITVAVRADPGARVEVGLLESAAGGRLAVGVRPSTGELQLGRIGWPAVPPRGDVVAARFTPAAATTLRLLLDGSVLEVFAGDEAALTERVYARADDRPVLSVAGAGGRAEVTVICWAADPPGRAADPPGRAANPPGSAADPPAPTA